MLYVALNEQLLDILLNLIVGYVPPGLIYCTGPRMCSGGGITHFLLGFFFNMLITWGACHSLQWGNLFLEGPCEVK